MAKTKKKDFLLTLDYILDQHEDPIITQTIEINEDDDSYRTIKTWISEFKKKSVLKSEMYNLFLDNTRYCTYFKNISVRANLDISIID